MANKDPDILTLPHPAQEWRDAWPAGNGIVGALVQGDPHNESIIFNHEDCWLYGRTMELPDVSESLQEVRDLMAGREYQRAHNLYRDRLKDEGYTPHMASYSPLATLKLVREVPCDISDYSRNLNMCSGETEVSWKYGEDAYHRELFVSRSDGLVHCRLRCSGSGSPDLVLGLEPMNGEAEENWFSSRALELSRESTDEKLNLTLRDSAGRTYSANLEVLSQDGEIRQEGNRLRISGARDIHIAVRVLADTGWTGSAQENSGGFDSPDYPSALEAHRQLHNELYKRVTLRLEGESVEAVQNMFNYGRYLIIAGSGGHLPPNLQGIWNGDILPIWNCFFMLNENIQMMHWQSLPGNYAESLFPMFDYYESRIDDFRENARKLFGCRGIFIPANTVPDTGLLTDLQGHLIHWTPGAAWLARFYFDYYLYTGDQNFLEERALPLMKETVLFFEDYLYENKQGQAEFCPSVSPENAPEEFNQLGKMDAMCNVTVNATMDVALCREVLTNLLTTLRICDINDPGRDRWKEMLDTLPDYRVNDDGAIREWLHDDFTDNYHHRHLSHIYPFFPGTEIKPGETEVEMFETAVEKRLVIGLKEQTGWSMVHLANIYARMGRGNRAMECLGILQDYCTGENLFTYHNDWREQGVCEAKPKHFKKRVFQIDANLGYPAAIMEMLCFSEPGSISLLPGLPDRFEEGKITGLRCRGNIGLNLEWSGERIAFNLESPTEQKVNIKFPSEIRNLSLNGSGYSGGPRVISINLPADREVRGNAEII